MGEAKFVTGNIMRHIWVMTSTSAIGISALFVVDLLDMFFLSLLGQDELAAAVGYAGTITFFTTSIGIGLSIALGAVVSKAIGQRDFEHAKRLSTNASAITVLVAVLVAIAILCFVPQLLDLVGATGTTKTYAEDFLYVVVPSMPIICLAMALGAALRAVGDAKLYMMSAIIGGLVNAALDPVFIFWLDMGIEGAAAASVAARFATLFVTLYGVLYKHDLLGRFRWSQFQVDFKPIYLIALPAMLTNIATPIGNGFVIRAIADYGNAYVAAWAVIGRIIPVAFGMIFALSGAIGPIVGQNFGAERFDRVKEALTKANWFCLGYVVLASIILLLCREMFVSIFALDGQSAEMVYFFFTYIAIFFYFNGVLFVANAAFNNLGKPKYSTFFNIGKATIGTVPFLYVGGYVAGIYGVLIGQVVGAVLFGVAGMLLAYRLVDRVTTAHQQAQAPVEQVCQLECVEPEELAPVTSSPLSSCHVQMAQMNENDDNSDKK